MKEESHFTQDDRVVLHEVKDKQEEIPREVKDYMTDRLNEFTLTLSEHISQTIQGAVKITVNGKIDNLTKILTSHIVSSKPSMDFIDDLQSTNKVMQFVLKLVALIGVSLSTIWGAITFLKN